MSLVQYAAWDSLCPWKICLCWAHPHNVGMIWGLVSPLFLIIQFIDFFLFFLLLLSLSALLQSSVSSVAPWLPAGPSSFPKYKKMRFVRLALYITYLTKQGQQSLCLSAMGLLHHLSATHSFQLLWFFYFREDDSGTKILPSGTFILEWENKFLSSSTLVCPGKLSLTLQQSFH